MLLCNVLPHQKVQTYVTSKITTSIDIELEYLEVEYIAGCWLLADLAFSECSVWTYGLNKLSDRNVGAKNPTYCSNGLSALYLTIFG